MENTHQPPASLGRTLGAVLIGTSVVSVLYGITGAQAIVYFRSSPEDGITMKSTIVTLWVLETLHVALIVHVAYHYGVLNFSNPDALESPVASVYVQVYVTCLTDIIVRAAFARRVWLLNDRKAYQMALIMVPGIAGFFSGFVYASKAIQLNSFAKAESLLTPLYMSFLAGIASDVVITASLLLSLARSRTGFKQTDSTIITLIVYAINTGLLTTIVTLVAVITFAVWPHDLVFFGLEMTISGLYGNALLANLNARHSLRSRSYNSSTELDELGTSMYTNSAPNSHLSVQSRSSTLKDASLALNVNQKA